MERTPLFDDDTAEALRRALGTLEHPVKLVLFVEAPVACATCREQRRLLQEACILNPTRPKAVARTATSIHDK
jgi:hypothetical protein